MATAIVSAARGVPSRRRRDDRRDHAVRPGAAGRRHPREGAAAGATASSTFILPEMNDTDPRRTARKRSRGHAFVPSKRSRKLKLPLALPASRTARRRRPRSLRCPACHRCASVFFYISGHGFGHAIRDRSRSSMRSPRRARPADRRRTTAPRWLFDRTVRGRSTLSTGETRHRRRPDRQPAAPTSASHRRARAFHDRPR